MITLRPPDILELPALSALCLRSKAYWGYDEAFMAACVKELTLTSADLEDPVVVAVKGQAIFGLAQVSFDGTECYLEKLFVDPTQIGCGVGRTLFAWAVEAARDLGASEMIVEADPGAVPFYRTMGCVPAGEVESGSIAGRRIPRLVHLLA